MPDATHSHTVTSEDVSQVTLPVSSVVGLLPSHDDGLHQTATPGSKVIVMAKLEKEDTDWVARNLPEYTYHLQMLLLILTNHLQLGPRNLHG